MRRAGSVVKKSLGTSPSATATDDAQETERQKPRPQPPPAVPAMPAEQGMGSSGELGIDFPILPSTSSFTLPGKEDKGEKLKKKARNFLDERQKIKSRAQSLWSYIDAANTFDQARFFQENAEQVFHVVYETCIHHIEKMKQKNERPQSWTSKDLVTLQKNLLLLRKIFLYVPELMRNGWQRKNIAKLLAHILDHGNHLRLRALGFHLLLLWLNDQVVEYPECMELFANAIALDLFVLDEIKSSPSASANAVAENAATEEKETFSTPASKSHGSGLNFVKKLSERHAERTFGHGLSRDEKIKSSKLKLHQNLILGDEQAPLYPNPVQPTFNDSIVLLHIFNTNLVRLAYVAAGSPPPPDEYEYPPGDNVEADDGIATGVGIDAATASAKFMFRIFRTYYMSKFTPQIAKALKMDGVPSLDEDFGFPACPPCILRTLLRFLIGFCLDNNEKLYVGQWLHSATGTPSPATPILKSIVLSSYETREMLHELLRQAMILPCTNPEYRDITRGAMHILGVWMLGSEDERPSFLRRTGSWSLIASNTQGSITRSSSHSSALTSAADEDDYKSADANMFLRRYFLMIKLIFDQHSTIDTSDPNITDWDGLVSLYKDALNVYRAVTVSRGGIDIDVESWELLLHCLMDIQDRFLSQGQKYSRIPNRRLAEDFAEYLSETLLHAFVRAKITHMDIWKDLKKHLLASTRWTESLQSWVKIMHKLTRLLSARLYNVEYDAHPSDRSDEHHRYSLHIVSNNHRSRAKVRSRHLSIQGDLRTGSKRTTGRPLSSGASDGQLMENPPPPPPPMPEDYSDGAIVRNVSNISLSERGSKTSDRRSGVIQDLEESEEASSNVKFGAKTAIPTSSTSSNIAQAQQPVVTGNGSQRRANTSRRTVSIHQLDTLFQESGSKLLSFVQHHGDAVEPTASTSKVLSTARDEEEKRKQSEWDRKSMGSSVERMPLEESVALSTKSNRTSVSLVLPTGETISLTTSTAAVNEKLPASLGIFKSSEFLNFDNIPADGTSVLLIWKNMLCAIGNVNELQSPQDHMVVMSCVVDIWDTLEWIRAHQPYHVEYMPALYEMAPWFLQAAELPPAYDAGRAIAYGCLCRLFCHRPEETVPETYYAYFYRALLKGLSSSDTTITESIIRNSERLFSASLPSAYILIPSFFDAIERQLLDGDTPRDVSIDVRRSCITILGSFVSISNHFKDVRIDLQRPMTSLGETEFAFSDIKIWLKDLLLRLVNGGTPMDKIEQDPDVRCMVLGVICSLALDELLVNASPLQGLVQESVLAMVKHLYWSNINIVNTAVDCLNALAQMYREELDSDGVIVEEVLTRIIDALNVHLKYYERHSKDGRGFIISKLFSCLLEWLMVIDPMILSETELCQLVFDVIEYALHITSEGGSEKLLPHPPDLRPENRRKKEVPFKFKLLTEKRPPIHQEYANVVAPEVSESDQGYVKESAEATLLHLLHHFNNFAPPSGPATIHSTIAGPGVAQEENEEHMGYQYFSYNESTIIAFVELPPQGDSESSIARIIVRDVTGRYVWDSRLEPKTVQSSDQTTKREEHLHKEHGYTLREGLQVHTPEEIQETMKRDPNSNVDKLQELLKGISSSNADCQETAHTPLPLTQHQAGMVGRLGEQLDEFLQDESKSNSQQESNTNLWFSKINVLRRNATSNGPGSLHHHLTANFALRKDFSPAFPHETEKSQVPFQQSRLLLSHLGFINYDQLKDGSFQMLKKTPALYRDLRGLDRKHGRETMKIAVIYVGPGQEDEQSILHNSQGSPQYNAFVNSLGWEIDIATHTGYLGGLERNLTNGTRANYFCNSTLEMIFHDVTKMPTEADDPKQLKKKRHVGNDHVHIVWNEHDRDYQIGTIGGDFGNAQIVVSPLPNGLYAIRVYRDAKVPYFGPLFDGMVVSQAILGPLVRATAINAFRRSIHNNYYSFYKCVFAQRANDVKTITNRHKVATWSYEHFMEKIFMPSAE